jgi:hypothetical protein
MYVCKDACRTAEGTCTYQAERFKVREKEKKEKKSTDGRGQTDITGPFLCTLFDKVNFEIIYSCEGKEERRPLWPRSWSWSRLLWPISRPWLWVMTVTVGRKDGRPAGKHILRTYIHT